MTEAITEEAVVFPDAAPTLVGIYSPATASSLPDAATVVLLNGGLLPRSGPNRLHVRIARRLAEHGIASLRFDLSGIGDSAPRQNKASYRQGALRDVRDAGDFLTEKGCRGGIVLLGLCSGADLALRAALSDHRVVGLVLIDGLPYSNLCARTMDELRRVRQALVDSRWRRSLFEGNKLGRVLKRVVGANDRPKAAAGPAELRDAPTLVEARAMLASLAGRNVLVLAIFTEGRGYSYRQQFRHLFPRLEPDAVTVAQVEGADHTFNLVATQERLIAIIDEWMKRHSSTPAPGRSAETSFPT